jgi:hypothetical protein
VAGQGPERHTEGRDAPREAVPALDVARVVDDYLALTAGENPADSGGGLEVEALTDPHHHGSLLGRLARGDDEHSR